MIRLGPAGVPLSCKGRTLKDGVKSVQELGLNAMEVQFSRGARYEKEYLAEVGHLAASFDIELGMHSPYYTNLGDPDDEQVDKTIDKIFQSAEMAELMGAKVCVAHPGFYTTLSKEETKDRITMNVQMLRELMEGTGLTVPLGLEVMGKQQTFGTLDEVIEVCQAAGEGVIPVVDFAHIHARGNGSLQTKEDFKAIFDRLEEDAGLDWFYAYFTGVKYHNYNEVCHVPVKKGDLNFDLLAEVILEQGYDVTLVSVSPIVEHDAMYMKLKIERQLERMLRQGLVATPVGAE